MRPAPSPSRGGRRAADGGRRANSSDDVVLQMEETVAAAAAAVAPSSATTSEDRFQRASFFPRTYQCLNKCLEAKKSCILILFLAAFLVVELTKLFVPPGSSSAGLQQSAEKTLQLATRALELLGGGGGGGGGVYAFPQHGPRGSFGVVDVNPVAANDTEHPH